jgi:hypothetical protein
MTLSLASAFTLLASVFEHGILRFWIQLVGGFLFVLVCVQFVELEVRRRRIEELEKRPSEMSSLATVNSEAKTFQLHAPGKGIRGVVRTVDLPDGSREWHTSTYGTEFDPQMIRSAPTEPDNKNDPVASAPTDAKETLGDKLWRWLRHGGQVRYEIRDKPAGK